MKQSELRQKIAEQFIASLKDDKLPWHALWLTQRPENALTGKRYRGLNSFWLSFIADIRGYKDHRWCTFKQAKDRGWHVKKGEHSVQIEYWRLYDKQQKKYVEQYEANMIINADPDRKDDIILTCRTYSVFNGDQIEGIPELPMSPKIDIAEIRSKRDVLLKNMDLKFEEKGTQAYYRHTTDSITMPAESFFLDNYGYMSTFLHECGHATGHEKRLNRDLSGIFGSPEYAKEELRAEIASAFTSQALGFGYAAEDLSGAMNNHKAYIQSWIEAIEDQPNELFAAIKDAEQISDYLLEKGELVQSISEIKSEPVIKPSLDRQIQTASMRIPDSCAGMQPKSRCEPAQVSL